MERIHIDDLIDTLEMDMYGGYAVTDGSTIFACCDELWAAETILEATQRGNPSEASRMHIMEVYA